MNSIINIEVYSSTFSFPSQVIDEYVKLASTVQLKVLLYIFRHSSTEKTAEDIANDLAFEISEVEDAISFWAELGILKGTKKALKKQETKKAHMQSAKPTREEVARLGAQDENLQFLMREAQAFFARPLRQAETSLLAWLYSAEGMEVSVILMLLQFAVKQGKVNTRFIESTAIQWIDSGVETIEDAENKMREELLCDQCCKLMFSAFGILGRKPTKNEKELALLWVNEWKYDRLILEKAYEICIDTTGKFSMPYIKKIIEKWHKIGVKTVKDITDEKPEANKDNQYSSYIKDLEESED